MKEHNEEHNKKLSKDQEKFLALIMVNPYFVFMMLRRRDIIKPLIWQDLKENGGKHGYRGIAKKYNISQDQARTIIKNIKKNISSNG